MPENDNEYWVNRARQRVLREQLLPERLAPLITGSNDEELAASAHEVANDLGIRPAATEAVMLARSALKHAAAVRALHGGDQDGEDQ